MLRAWKVTFSAAQFNTAMRQMTRSGADTPGASVGFTDFIKWWREFSAYGASRLLSINFDHRVLAVLKEVSHGLCQSPPSSCNFSPLESAGAPLPTSSRGGASPRDAILRCPRPAAWELVQARDCCRPVSR